METDASHCLTWSCSSPAGTNCLAQRLLSASSTAATTPNLNQITVPSPQYLSVHYSQSFLKRSQQADQLRPAIYQRAHHTWPDGGRVVASSFHTYLSTDSSKPVECPRRPTTRRITRRLREASTYSSISGKRRTQRVCRREGGKQQKMTRRVGINKGRDLRESIHESCESLLCQHPVEPFSVDGCEPSRSLRRNL